MSAVRGSRWRGAVPVRAPASVVVTVIVALLAAVLGACGGGDARPAAGASAGESARFRELGAGVAVDTAAPASLTSRETGKTFDIGPGLQALTPAVDVTPNGPLPKAITLRFDLPADVAPADLALASSETGAPGTWELTRPDRVDGRYAYVTQEHLSIKLLVKATAAALSAIAKDIMTNVMQGLAGETTLISAKKPVCSGQNQLAAYGYRYSGDALLWCLGSENGVPVLKLVNPKKYPMIVTHPGLHSEITSTIPEIKTWEHFLSDKLAGTDRSVIMPNDELVLRIDLAPGSDVTISAEVDGMANALIWLNSGLTILTEIVGRFGGGLPSFANRDAKFAFVMDKTGDLLSISDCAANIGDDPSWGRVITSCFDTQKLVDAFDAPALALFAPALFTGQVLGLLQNAVGFFADTITGHTTFRVYIKRNKPAELADGDHFAYVTAPTDTNLTVDPITYAWGYEAAHAACLADGTPDRGDEDCTMLHISNPDTRRFTLPFAPNVQYFAPSFDGRSIWHGKEVGFIIVKADQAAFRAALKQFGGVALLTARGGQITRAEAVYSP